MKNNQDIPQKWIRNYVNKLLDIAKSLENNSAMQQTCLMRAEYIMDLVQAFQQENK